MSLVHRTPLMIFRAVAFVQCAIARSLGRSLLSRQNCYARQLAHFSRSSFASSASREMLRRRDARTQYGVTPPSPSLRGGSEHAALRRAGSVRPVRTHKRQKSHPKTVWFLKKKGGPSALFTSTSFFVVSYRVRNYLASPGAEG